jgi:hypothetical protein
MAIRRSADCCASIKRLELEALKCTGAKTVEVVFAVPHHRNNALGDHFQHDIRLVRIRLIAQS